MNVAETIKEAVDAFRAFERSVGPKAHLSVSFNVDQWHGRQGMLYAALYPLGICDSDNCRLVVYADDFAGLLRNLEALWAESAERLRAERLREMALAIIRITAEQGACTDAALRADKFSDAEVKQYGEDAIAEANSMAANGPFSIQRVAGANAA